MKKIIKVSVRNLIEFVLRSGDIDNSFMSMNRALEGTLAHQKVQKSYGHEYKPEVRLKHEINYKEFTIILEGRADGIFTFPDEIIVDEIKSTTKELKDIEENYNELHWAQVKCYGYIYAFQNKLEEIKIQLTYFHIESEETKIFKKNYNLKELEDYFYNIIHRYIEWASLTFYWGGIRDNTIKELKFPFPQYRKGQRELAVASYQTIVEGKNIFVQAPTGIGKTMSTLFPSIKAIGEGISSKIFYLTAKTITREVPIASMDIMMDKGLRMKSLVITAKDKICTNNEVKCNPRDCQYAKGHYDRVNDGIMDIFQNEDLMTRDIIVEYAKKHRVCPFEFTLDISLWADIIICDYNYVFDPQVYLKRFFEGKIEDYVFLIDEAHNLVDRSREMFSAEINKSQFLDLRHIFKEEYPKIYKGINKCNSLLNKLSKSLGDKENYYQQEELDEIYHPIKRLMVLMEPWLIEEKDHKEYENVIELYFNLIKFIKISEFYDEHYVVSMEKKNSDFIVKLYCVDSSYLLNQALYRAKTSIFFSATLTPLEYHLQLLGGNPEDYNIRLSSPFPQNNLCLMINEDISTRYKDRENTYLDIVENIHSFTEKRKGNYFVFFPSYKYMTIVYDLIKEKYPHMKIIIQEGQMTELEKEEFLKEFHEKNNVIGFAVLGGIFSEGIDLTGEKLIGAIIVGVALPQICFERDIIKDYYNNTVGQGFDYAYTYPGMNKVLQGAGRVIRSEYDRGAILLIDDRYGTNRYRKLFPREWSHNRRIFTNENLDKILKEFWENKY